MYWGIYRSIGQLKPILISQNILREFLLTDQLFDFSTSVWHLEPTYGYRGLIKLAVFCCDMCQNDVGLFMGFYTLVLCNNRANWRRYFIHVGQHNHNYKLVLTTNNLIINGGRIFRDNLFKIPNSDIGELPRKLCKRVSGKGSY